MNEANDMGLEAMTEDFVAKTLSALDILRLFLIVGFQEGSTRWAEFIPTPMRPRRAGKNTEIIFMGQKPQNVNWELLGLLLFPYDHEQLRYRSQTEFFKVGGAITCEQMYLRRRTRSGWLKTNSDRYYSTL